MKVAILGTGKMGAPMAVRLDGQGHDLTIWNRTRARAEAVGVGTVASTPAEAVRDVDVVISILTDAAAVRSAYLGEGGAVEAARDQVFVEMSTAGAEVSKEIAAKLPAYVEAPLFGSVGALAEGKAVILTAGDEAAIERARPVLSDIGDVRIIGELGSAAALKLIGNTMLADLYAVASELMSAGVAAGVPAEEVFFILNRFAPLLSQRKAGFVEHRYEPVTFALRDMVKDLNLGHALFQQLGVPTPMSDESRRLFEQVMPQHADDEVTAVASLYEGQTARSRR